MMFFEDCEQKLSSCRLSHDEFLIGLTRGCSLLSLKRFRLDTTASLCTFSFNGKCGQMLDRHAIGVQQSTYGGMACTPLIHALQTVTHPNSPIMIKRPESSLLFCALEFKSSAKLRIKQLWAVTPFAVALAPAWWQFGKCSPVKPQHFVSTVTFSDAGGSSLKDLNVWLKTWWLGQQTMNPAPLRE